MTTPIQTWQWGRGLVTWSHTLPARSGEDWRASLGRSTSTLIDLIPPFGRVARVDVTTEERGDDAFVFGPDDLGQLPEVLASREQAHRVTVTLDLAVVNDDETWLRSAARVYLDRDKDSDDANIDLWFTIDVDVYAPRTLGECRDNTVLARVNGPRLTAFLRRIRDRLDARLYDIDVGDYAGMVNADGFV